jgi:hypothetical protein
MNQRTSMKALAESSLAPAEVAQPAEGTQTAEG